MGANLEAANNYAAKGWTVIACQPRSKSPAVTEWKSFQTKKPSWEDLRKWFPGDANNLAILTGKGSGIVVLDVDNPDALDDYDIPETLTVKTAKGYHYYFKHPGCAVSNGPIKGLGDIKADGGYVVAPPSLHETGKRYEWVDPEAPLAECPEWIISKSKAREIADRHNESFVKEPPTLTDYAKGWLGDVDKLAMASKGGRNDLLNRVARRAGQLKAIGELNGAYALSVIKDACIKNGLYQEDRRAFNATFNSGFDSGVKEPAVKVDPIETVRVLDPVRRKLRTVKASDVVIEDVDWLWKDFLARGLITILSSDPGTGKSLVSHSITAAITNGSRLPLSPSNTPVGKVLYLSREEDLSRTLVPRLIAAGCNLDNVELMRFDDISDNFSLRTDTALLKELIEEIGNVSLVIVDPISSFVVGMDSNDGSAVRSVTDPLISLAADLGVCVLCIAHNNKSGANRKDIDRVAGSKQWVAAARMVYSVERDPNDSDRRLVMPIKSNLSTVARGFAFKAEAVPVRGSKELHPRAVWEDEYVKKDYERSGAVTIAAMDFPDDYPF